MEIRKYQDLSDNVGLVMVRQVIATLKQPQFYSGRTRKGTLYVPKANSFAGGAKSRSDE